MIRTLRGIFHPENDGTAVIETSGGIGFLLTIPANSPIYKNLDGEEVRVYTLMTVRQDDISLYGFDTKEELELFRLLITVNGVGAKAAMSIMGLLPEIELRRVIATGDTKTISQASGIGKKTAERIILELKDKVGDFFEEKGINDEDFIQNPILTDDKAEAIGALTSLGYTRSEAEVAVGKVKGENLSVEDYIKNALKQM